MTGEWIGDATPTPLLLRMSPGAVWGIAFILGWLVFGLSISLGVGDSYTKSINWGPNFIVIAPFLAAAMVHAVQAGDEALRSLAGAGMLVDQAGTRTTANPALDAWRRRLRSWSWKAAATLATGAAVSIGEWWTRYDQHPVAWEWWTQSPVVGIAGAILQGLFIGAVVVFLITMTSYCWTVLALARGEFHVTIAPGDRADDESHGFGVFCDCLESVLLAALLLYVALWAANVQHIAIEYGVANGERMSLGELLIDRSVLDVGPNHYSSHMTIICCVTVLSLTGMVFYWLHRAFWLSTQGATTARSPWLLPYLSLPKLVSLLLVAQVCFVFYHVALVAIAAIAVVVIGRAARALSPG